MNAVTLRLLLSLFAVVALLAAPLGMRGEAAMMEAHDMPHGSAIESGHCEGMTPHEGTEDEGSIDCAIACAALPAIAQDAAIAWPLAVFAPEAIALSSLDGTLPEAETPPPRTS